MESERDGVWVNLDRDHAQALIRAAAAYRGDLVPADLREAERAGAREAAAALEHAWGDGSTARGREVSVGLRISDRTGGGHVQGHLFVGRTRGARGNAGWITLREDEWAALKASGWEEIDG